MFFAFVANGAEGKLLVDKRKPNPKVVETAKKECGGHGQIYRGRCTWIDEIMVFQVVKAAPVSIAALTKKVIKIDAGLHYDVEYRVAEDAELDEPEESTEPVPLPEGQVSSPLANPAAVRFTARLKTLAPVLQKVEAINQPLAAEARTLLSVANQNNLAQQYDVANADLDHVESLLKQGLASGLRDAVPPPPPLPTAPPGPAQPGPEREGKADGSAVALAKIKIQWNQAKQLLKGQLDQLAGDVLNDSEEVEAVESEADEDGSDDMLTAVAKLAKVLTRLNEGLADTLDELYSAEISARPPLYTRLSDITERYLAYLADDELVALVEENPYRKVMVRGLLSLPLTKLQEQLAATASK